MRTHKTVHIEFYFDLGKVGVMKYENISTILKTSRFKVRLFSI